MSPKIVDRDEKRKRIALAAAELFAVRGFDRVKMDDVAKAAGVGKGTLYEYFKDKNELIHGSFHIMMEQMEEAIRSSIAPTALPLEMLKSLIDGTIAAMSNLGHQYMFFLEYMLFAGRTTHRFEFFGTYIGEYRLAIENMLTGAVALGQMRSDLDVKTTAAAFAAWFDGAVFHWITNPNPSMREMADLYFETFLHGILIGKNKGGSK